jgi:glycosyltransferase involved in cell wall biosynthesis
MAAVPPHTPLIIDGLLFGGMATGGFERIHAPVIAMIHHPLGLETGLSAERSSYLLALEKANLIHADHVLVPSAHTADTLVGDFDVPRNRITIAPPGFALAKPPLKQEGPPLILSVGLLAARKGHDVLIDALARLSDLDWRCQIVGGPHDRMVKAKLIAQIDRLGLTKRVHLAGLVSDEQLSDLFRSAHIFALATRYEGYGMVFGDAMRHGLPIVACATGAVSETVPESAGILTRVDNPSEFADAIRTYLTDASAYARTSAGSAAAGAALPTWPQAVTAASSVISKIAACGPHYRSLDSRLD